MKLLERRTQIAKVRENNLALKLAEVAEDDINDLIASKRAKELDTVEAGLALLPLADDDLKLRGWTRNELRCAIDAKRNSKEVPYYLKMLDNRTTARWRDGTGEKPSSAAKVVMPVQVIVNQADRDNAPIINIGEDKP